MACEWFLWTFILAVAAFICVDCSSLMKLGPPENAGGQR